MRSLACLLAALMVALTLMPSAAIAQRVTLFDLLFGDRQQQQRQQQPQQQQPQQQPPQQQQPQQQQQPAAQPRQAAPAPVALPDARPSVDKAENATRLAVFGDSLAVDLARALERTYADDPNLAVLGMGVGSSGFVRDDFFDWNRAVAEEIARDSFDMAVMIIGINDRQPLTVGGRTLQPLTDEWKAAYQQRLTDFLAQMRAAGKPVIWVGLPPMEASTYSAAITEISGIHRLASFSGGAAFVDIYERFTDENGRYAVNGPDINGQIVPMRKSDGIHFSNAGSDKVAFYIAQAVRQYYHGGGGVSIEVADPLQGTDAQHLTRLPFQGLGQIRMLEVAGAVMTLGAAGERAGDLVVATPASVEPAVFDYDAMLLAPVGRADAFGVGVEFTAAEEEDGEDAPAGEDDLAAETDAPSLSIEELILSGDGAIEDPIGGPERAVR